MQQIEHLSLAQSTSNVHLMKFLSIVFSFSLALRSFTSIDNKSSQPHNHFKGLEIFVF